MIDERITQIESNIEKALVQIGEWEEEIASLRQTESVVDAITEAYWHTPISVNDLKSKYPDCVFQLATVVKPYRPGWLCPDCGELHIIRSRMQFIKLFGKNPFEVLVDPQMLCTGCRGKKVAAKEEKRRAKEKADLKRVVNYPSWSNRKAEYHQYLSSDEWKEKRTAHVKRAGYRCQVCNAGNTTLNVHHRTYERVGSEQYEDLIALCSDCHSIFHEKGKLEA